MFIIIIKLNENVVLVILFNNPLKATRFKRESFGKSENQNNTIINLNLKRFENIFKNNIIYSQTFQTAKAI